MSGVKSDYGASLAVDDSRASKPKRAIDRADHGSMLGWGHFAGGGGGSSSVRKGGSCANLRLPYKIRKGVGGMGGVGAGKGGYATSGGRLATRGVLLMIIPQVLAWAGVSELSNAAGNS